MPIEIAILVSSYQRPWHLARVLASIEAQRNVDDRIEVVVTDDGSTDDSQDVANAFAARVKFPVHWTNHDHNGFQLARCRNEGVAASTAPYLLFLDGDCLIPPDHIWHHLNRRRPHIAQAGYCCLLDEQTTREMTLADVYASEFCQHVSLSEKRKLVRMHRKAQLYGLLRHATKPKLFGGNIGIHRSDYERVNGYDENFRGWGCEDDDLRLRLRSSGVRIQSILGVTRTYHLWHHRDETTPQNWREGANVEYLRRSHRPFYCTNGLDGHRVDDPSFRVRHWNVKHKVVSTLRSA